MDEIWSFMAANLAFYTYPMIAFFALAALSVGSFLATLIHRLPVDQPITTGRSACPQCGHGLNWRDLIPLASWALARGRCRYCSGHVSPFYPLMEIAALGIGLWSLAVVPFALLLVTCLFGWALLALAIIDLRTLTLPHVITMPLIGAGLLVGYAVTPTPWALHLLGALAGWGVLSTIYYVYLWLRGREGLGRGDAWLFAAAGAWLSLGGLPSVLLIAAVLGLAGGLIRAFWRGTDTLSRPLPFGPPLAAATWLVWLYGPLVFR